MSLRRVWLCRYKSGWIGGDAIVVATTLEGAKKILKRSLEKRQDGCKTLEDDDWTEIDLNKSHAEIINNGDY